jgi:hypothetical protein
MRYSMDMDTVYLRNKKEIEMGRSKRLLYGNEFIRRKNDTFHVSIGIVGFCGKLIPFVRCERHLYLCEGTTEYLYTLEDTEKFMEGVEIDFLSEWFNEFTPKRHGYIGYRWEPVETSPLMGLFEEHSVPIFLVKYKDMHSGSVIELNACLKDIQFYRHKDPHSAYQEIFQYMSNDLARQEDPDVPVGDDVTLAESKGYDKWSFRKESTKKKKGG